MDEARDAAATVDEGTRAFTPEEVRGAFRGKAPARRPPASYRLWALAVAAVMVTLPLIYLGIVAAAGYAMYWHATRNHVVFHTVRNGKGAFLAYFGPLLVLGTVVFFLAKPLFARRGAASASRSIRREDEPTLFALVDGVCESVGAPKPIRVDVDCNLNASAGPEHGLLSLLRRRLVLTIGLPMAAVFEADQFAGVLAHEFGHFAQSAGMKLTYMIRSINAWFARVVYERDAWDEALASWSTSGNVYTILLGNIARLLVWLSRRILWALMMIGHAVSCTMARQMEFDADRCEALVAGSEASVGATRRLRIAGLAHAGAMTDLSESWKEGRLPDDLPRLVEANIPQIPPAGVAAIDEALAREKTGVFDTHPADRDRIAAVMRLHAPGTFHLEGPASAFFRDFDALSRDVTAEHYRGLLGEAFDPSRLTPYREVVQSYESRTSDGAALRRVYAGDVGLARPLTLPEATWAAADPRAAVVELEGIRGEQAEERARLDAASPPRGGDAFGRRVQAQAAVTLLGTGCRVKAADYGLSAGTLEAARSAAEEAGRDFDADADRLGRLDDLAGRRTLLALGLLGDEAFVAGLDGGEGLRDEARRLLPLASDLGARAVPALREVYEARGVLHSVLLAYQQDERNQGLGQAVLSAGSMLHARLAGLLAAIDPATPYPFSHGGEAGSLREFVLPGLPDAEDVGSVLQAAEQAGERLGSLYYRVLGRLAAAVERVEGALGLSPLALADAPGDNRPRDESASSGT